MRNREWFKSDYLLINTILFILLSSVFIYSLAFSSSGAYLLKSDCSNFPELCISKGMSRAFSQILLGNLDKAKQLNLYSLQVFNFLAVQWIFRPFFSVIYHKHLSRKLIISDIILSSMLFLYCFFPFFKKIYELI